MNDITMVAGDSAIIKVAVFDGDKRQYPITEWTCELHVSAEEQKIYYGEAAGNVAVFFIPEEELKEGGVFQYEIVISDGNGKKFTLKQGTITVLPKTTKR